MALKRRGILVKIHTFMLVLWEEESFVCSLISLPIFLTSKKNTRVELHSEVRVVPLVSENTVVIVHYSSNYFVTSLMSSLLLSHTTKTLGVQLIEYIQVLFYL